MSVKAVELKPCPFCGNAAEEWSEEGGVPWMFIEVVGCRRCHISFYNDKGEGVAKWNRRVMKE